MEGVLKVVNQDTNQNSAINLATVECMVQIVIIHVENVSIWNNVIIFPERV